MTVQIKEKLAQERYEYNLFSLSPEAIKNKLKNMSGEKIAEEFLTNEQITAIKMMHMI